MNDGNPWVAILVTIMLVAVNGIMAASEIALVGLSEARLKESAKTGDKKANLLLRMKQNPSNFLSTIQIGITLASLLSGAFAADSLATPIKNWAASGGLSGFALSVVNFASVALVTLLITYFMLVFGELVPKRIAMSNPEGTAQLFIRPIHGLSVVAKPLVRLLAASTNGILRLSGVSVADEEEAITEQEILLMVRAGHAQGTIDENEAAIVANLFEFTDNPVVEAMTHRTEMDALPVDASIQDVVELMSVTFHSRFPIYEGNLDHIIGVLYTQDIVALYARPDRDSSAKSIRELMRAPLFVPETLSQSRLFSQMKREHTSMAIVVDEFGGTSGLVTLMDIIEEIVGDVEPDDWDEAVTLEDGRRQLDGRMEMEDVAALLDLQWNEKMQDTLSGFLIARLGFIPKAGETPSVAIDGYHFQIMEMEGTRIRRVLVTNINPQ